MSQKDITRAATRLPFYRQRWVQVLAVILLLSVIGLITLPYFISYSAKRWILANGGDRVQVTDVDFNPFTGILALEGAQVHLGEEKTLDIGTAGIQIDWTPMFQRRALIRNISLEHFSISIERDRSGTIRIGGITLPEAKEGMEEVKSEAPWGIGLDQIALANCTIRYRDPQFQTTAIINKLTLSELADWMPDRAAALHLDGSLDGAAIVFEGEVSPFAEQPGVSGQLSLSGLQIERFASFVEPALTTLAGTLSIDSQIKAQQDQKNIITLFQKGTISVGALNVATEAETVSNENTEWNGSISTAVNTQPGTIQLRTNGSLSVGPLNITTEAETVSNANFAWSGITNVNTTNNAGLEVETDGDLSLEKLVVGIPKRDDLLVRDGAISWKGKVRFDNSGEAFDLAASGDLEVHDLHATAEEQQINLIDMGTLRARTIVMDAVDQITVAQIDIKDLTLAEESAPDGAAGAGGSFNHIPELNITNVRYSDDAGLGIDSILETDVSFVISRDADGQWNAARLIDVLAKLADTEAETDELADTRPRAAKEGQIQAEAAPEETPAVRIGHWLVTGNNSLTFRDQSATPPFATTLNIAKLEVSDINGHNPDNPSPITIEGSIGKHTAVNISGTIKPFTAPVSYGLKGSIDALELPPLSSYTISQLGFELDSGQLDAEFEIGAEKGKLEGETDLTITQLDIGSINDEKLAEMESNLSVSLDVALSMLRDDNNVIRLKVPFSGTPDSPDFDVSDAVNQALGRAIKQGSMTYLTMALQPYGTLITVAKYAGKQATKVRLKPIEFAPGSSDLDSADLDYLAKVANILKERPKLNIKICGAAVQADRTTLAQQAAAAASASTAKEAKGVPEPIQVPDTQLAALAEERDDAVKDNLIAKHGVSAKRLVACEANIDLKETDAAPRTDLLI